MDQLELKFRGKRQARSEKDVTINMRKGGDVGMIFRNGCYKKIAPNTGHFGYAISGSRLYFCEFSKETGYKFAVSSKNATETSHVHFQGEDYDDLKSFAQLHGGSYPLTYDSKYQKFCIETDIVFNGKRGNKA